MAKYSSWTSVPAPDWVVAKFAGDITSSASVAPLLGYVKGHMAIHIAGTPWRANVSAMSPKQILQFWWWAVQGDMAQQTTWTKSPEEYVLSKGIGPPETAITPGPTATAGAGTIATVWIPPSFQPEAIISWAKANKLPALVWAIGLHSLLRGRGRRLF